MNTTAQNLLNDAGNELLEALWAEANAMGPNTEEIVKYMTGGESEAHSSPEQMEHVRHLLGPGASITDVILDSLKLYQATTAREQAALAYIKARRLAEATQESDSADGEPSIAEQANAERNRQLDLGYDAEHDDCHGLSHLRRVQNSYPHDSVKYAAMQMAINDWFDRNPSATA